jgi:outer membrane protein assembly factor BamB
MRLDDTPRRLLLVGEHLAVFVRMGQQQSQGVALIDPASGAVARQILPACSAEHGASLLYYDTPAIFSPDGATMYVISGHSQACLQRWDLASGQLVVEQALPPGSGEISWRQEAPPLLIDGAIFYAGDDKIYALDATSGAARTLIADKQAHFYPVAGREGVLVVLTNPTWDSNRWTILGLDMQTGARRWQFAVQGQAPLGFGSSADWLWRLTPKGLTVVQLPRAGSGQIMADALDLQTGVSAGQQVTPVGGHRGVTSAPLLTDERIWLNFGDQIYALDATTGKLAYTIP